MRLVAAGGSLPPGDKGWFLGLEPAVHILVHNLAMARGGSISAEHGLGVLRGVEAAGYKSAVEIRLMRAVKDALVQLRLMNPGKGSPVARVLQALQAIVILL